MDTFQPDGNAASTTQSQSQRQTTTTQSTATMTHQHEQPHPIKTTQPIQILTSALASPNQASPTSTHAAADAARAMKHTQGWTPIFNRRQSWSREDQKRELLMKVVVQDGACEKGIGFTEK